LPVAVLWHRHDHRKLANVAALDHVALALNPHHRVRLRPPVNPTQCRVTAVHGDALRWLTFMVLGDYRARFRGEGTQYRGVQAGDGVVIVGRGRRGRTHRVEYHEAGLEVVYLVQRPL